MSHLLFKIQTPLVKSNFPSFDPHTHACMATFQRDIITKASFRMVCASIFVFNMVVISLLAANSNSFYAAVILSCRHFQKYTLSFSLSVSFTFYLSIGLTHNFRRPSAHSSATLISFFSCWQYYVGKGGNGSCLVNVCVQICNMHCLPTLHWTIELNSLGNKLWLNFTWIKGFQEF